MQKPDQRPDGAVRDAVDRANGGGHRSTQSHLSIRRLRSLLGIPHRTGSETTIPGTVERRSKVATPKRFYVRFLSEFGYDDVIVNGHQKTYFSERRSVIS